MYNTVVGRPSLYFIGPDGMLIVLVLTLVAHEALHAAGYAIAGAKARFGIGMLGILPVLYTTVKDNKKLTISQVLFAGYLPFVALSVLLIMIGIIFPHYGQVTSFAFIVNAAGSVGDLYIATKLWKYAGVRGIRVTDTKDGFEIYSTSK